MSLDDVGKEPTLPSKFPCLCPKTWAIGQLHLRLLCLLDAIHEPFHYILAGLLEKSSVSVPELLMFDLIRQLHQIK